MGLLSFWVKEKESAKASFGEADYKMLAGALVGKGNVYQAFRFGQPSYPTAVVSIGFGVRKDSEFDRYLQLYLAFLKDHGQSEEGIILTRLATFRAHFKTEIDEHFYGLPDQEPFTEANLNVIVFPYGWENRELELERLLHLPAHTISRLRFEKIILKTVN